jgi:hypothetical protein
MPNVHVDWQEKTLSARMMFTVTSEAWNFPDDHVRSLDAALAALPLDNLVTFTPPYENTTRRAVLAPSRAAMAPARARASGNHSSAWI